MTEEMITLSRSTLRNLLYCASKYSPRCWPVCSKVDQNCECLRLADEAVEKILKAPADA